MSIDKKELKDSERLGKLETEVHLLTSGFSELKDLIGKLFSKLEDHQKDTAPKPVSNMTILAGIVSVLTILAILFGSVVWTISSMNSPLSTQINQLSNIQSSQNTLLMQFQGQIQLTNKEISGIKGKAESNANTLDWILFDENFLKKIIINSKDIETLQMQMNRIVDSKHKGGI